MKKIIATLLLLLIFVGVLSGCANKNKSLDYISVNVDITENEIIDMILLNEITNQINFNYLSYAFVEPDLSNHYEDVVLPEDHDSIKNYLTEGKIIIENCKKFDILVSMNDAEKTLQTEYEQIKADSTQDEYYNIILSTLKQNNITESQYLELMKIDSYYKYNKISFKKYFSTEFFDSSKNTTLDQQFDDYIKKCGTQKTAQ